MMDKEKIKLDFTNLEPISNISPKEIAEFMNSTVRMAYQNKQNHGKN
jgi:hypothetical protein